MQTFWQNNLGFFLPQGNIPQREDTEISWECELIRYTHFESINSPGSLNHYTPPIHTHSFLKQIQNSEYNFIH